MGGLQPSGARDRGDSGSEVRKATALPPLRTEPDRHSTGGPAFGQPRARPPEHILRTGTRTGRRLGDSSDPEPAHAKPSLQRMLPRERELPRTRYRRSGREGGRTGRPPQRRAAYPAGGPSPQQERDVQPMCVDKRVPAPVQAGALLRREDPRDWRPGERPASRRVQEARRRGEEGEVRRVRPAGEPVSPPPLEDRPPR